MALTLGEDLEFEMARRLTVTGAAKLMGRRLRAATKKRTRDGFKGGEGHGGVDI